MDWQNARNSLRKWREENVRCSDEVVRLWEEVLMKHSSKLSSEKWLVLEQVFIAALDCGRYSLAEDCLNELRDQFPSSLRIKKLNGMRLEALDKTEQAIEVYQSIIRADDTNSSVRKRMIVVSDSPFSAIPALTDYLQFAMGDQEAWLELCDRYIQIHEYGQAAFCLEEIILLNPHTHFYHQKYAEIRYTMGGIENLELARAYFCQAVKLKEDNVRGLYGILLTCGHLAGAPKTTPAKKKECSRLARWAGDRIKELYSGDTSSDCPPPEMPTASNQLTFPDSGSAKSKKKPNSPNAAAVLPGGTKTGGSDAERRDLGDMEAVEALISALTLVPASGV
ncbi:unnamed protein product [Notodromas monacha]|uniref:ER membrane protein complex subunit 2 n=1 Tax=Notodromas monacha TaxID=399045 RepID=A0A7R9GG19_9CRUS|nr:unnamed protein product [Notodromas monacha]CAG0919511.1 unnamed protein product [Notodromas monacha]